ncbi:N-acetylglucosamine-6-phosphate deacetylase [Tremella mesenterica]|uniref:N-acetylglucosamine-6-phosphate deacetylase n=1 Tax=Tremella mesenterica TaxID=5217 RepID=A0A4Q1BDS5_TREME|nr:N-acetylglucosamine-6-phosphate deacetylase [Tremella mesenterica]
MPIGASLEVIDCMGGTISPGMVDIQINGGFGVDLSDFTSPVEYLTGLDKLSEELLRMGVTSYVPTVISQKPEVYKKILPLLMERAGKFPKSDVLSATPLGFHVEGPFLAPLKKGCHPSENIAMVNEGIADFENMYGSEAVAPNREMVRIVTVAPDVQGVLPCIPELRERGITVALCHTNATTEQALQGIINGATLLTHIFNAMPPLHHRDPSIIGLLGQMASRPSFSIIADGVHVHPQAVALAYRAYPEGCILISDAMHFMDPDLPDGVYPWRESAIEKRGMTLTLDGTDTLAGSILPMPEAVINLSKFADIPLERAIACATYTPAKLLGGLFKESHGLVPGCKADVLLWDKEGLKGVWKGGREV